MQTGRDFTQPPAQRHSIIAAQLQSIRVAAFKNLCASANTRIEEKAGLETSSALNQVNDQDDDGNYEQEMNQAAANVADETKKPAATACNPESLFHRQRRQLISD